MARKEKDVQKQVANADLSMFKNDGGVGFEEGLDQGAYAMPFLSLLQALSPAVQRGGPDMIPGAQPGMLINTVTKELFPEGVDVSVVRRTHTFCRWTPRDDGGGFIGEYAADEAAVADYQSIEPDDKGRRIRNGEEITEHRNFYTQIVREGNATEPLLISMTKSQLGVARQWNSIIAMKSARVGANPVALSEVYTINSKLRTKGENSWYMFTVAHKERHSDQLVYDQVKEGVAFAREQRIIARPALEAPAENEGM